MANVAATKEGGGRFKVVAKVERLSINAVQIAQAETGGDGIFITFRRKTEGLAERKAEAKRKRFSFISKRADTHRPFITLGLGATATKTEETHR